MTDQASKPKEQEAKSPDKPLIVTWGAFILSIISFVTSLFSIYLQYYREDHELRAVVTRIESGVPTVTAKVVLSNTGARTEVLNSISLAFGSGAGFALGDSAESCILKPGDAKVVDIKNTLAPNPQQSSVPVSVFFNIVNTQNSRDTGKTFIETRLPVTRLTVQGGRVTGAKPDSEEKPVVDLYKGTALN